MLCLRVLLALTFLPLSAMLHAQSEDSLLISITSPDAGTTFAYSTTKNHALVWNKKDQILSARVTFTDQGASGLNSDDTHSFRLPGVTFDPAKGMYYATSAKGVVVPVAHNKKALFGSSIETLPNARVRIQNFRGSLSVILEAISPDDPLLHPKQGDADGSHHVDLHQLF